MKIKYILLFFAAALFYSCNQSDVGIFYGLENEVKITDNSLSNNLTIGSMAKNGTELYIAAGRVYTKTSGSSEDWRKVSIPSGYDLSTSLASDDLTYVYAVFYDTDTADTALFRMTNGGNWTKVTDPDFEGSFEYVKSANNTILVSTRIDSNDANLYYFDGGGFTEVAGINMTGSEFYVIHDGTDFWVSNSNILYQGDITLGTMTSALTLDSTVEIKGLSESASGAYIYLSCWDRENRDGYLMATDGTAGTIEVEGENKTYKLFNLTAFRAEGYDFLLCGTNGLGYRQILSPSSSNLDLDTPDDDVLSENYTSAIELQNSAVIDFFVDGDPDGDIYALTATNGLWKNSLSGGTRVWSIE